MGKLSEMLVVLFLWSANIAKLQVHCRSDGWISIWKEARDCSELGKTSDPAKPLDAPRSRLAGFRSETLAECSPSTHSSTLAETLPIAFFLEQKHNWCRKSMRLPSLQRQLTAQNRCRY